jgi:hypothetical protein
VQVRSVEFALALRSTNLQEALLDAAALGTVDGEALAESEMKMVLEILGHVGALVPIVDTEEPEVFDLSLGDVLRTVVRGGGREAGMEGGRRVMDRHLRGKRRPLPHP